MGIGIVILASMHARPATGACRAWTGTVALENLAIWPARSLSGLELETAKRYNTVHAVTVFERGAGSCCHAG